MVLKELIFTVSILARCGDLEGSDFLTVSVLGGCGDLEILILIVSTVRRVWWSSKNLFLTVVEVWWS